MRHYVIAKKCLDNRINRITWDKSSKNDRKTQINIEIRDFFPKSGGTCPPCPPPSDAHASTYPKSPSCWSTPSSESAPSTFSVVTRSSSLLWYTLLLVSGLQQAWAAIVWGAWNIFFLSNPYFTLDIIGEPLTNRNGFSYIKVFGIIMSITKGHWQGRTHDLCVVRHNPMSPRDEDRCSLW